MTRRKRITIVLLIIIVFILMMALFVYLLLSRNNGEQTQTQEPEQIEQVQEIIPTRPTISEQEEQKEQEVRVTSSDIVSLSKSFVTRYGSYSNESDFANLEDVLPLMSASFAQETVAFMETAESPETYYGVTTNVVTVQVNNQTDQQAEVLVTTQRVESINSPQNQTIRYQEILLVFVKEDGVWKVDSADWQ